MALPRPEAASAPTSDTQRMTVKASASHEFLKLIEELKALKSRSYTLDLQKMEEQQAHQREQALKDAERKAGRGNAAEAQRLQAEARKISEMELDQSKEILKSKFLKIDQGLAALHKFLSELGPVKELEVRLHDQEKSLKKAEDELRVQRKVLAHEQEELEREKELLRTAESALAERQQILDEQLGRLDVVKRAGELDQARADLDLKIQAFDHETALIAKERDELNKDFDKLGQKRAELDAEQEKLAAERATLQDAKRSMAEVVAKEFGATFEAFVRDMLRPPQESSQ